MHYDFETMQAIGSMPNAIAAQLSSHIQDKDIHVTAAEKEALSKITTTTSDGESSTSPVDLSGYAKLEDIPTKLSQLKDDVGYTMLGTEYATKTDMLAWVKEGLADDIVSEITTSISSLQSQLDALEKKVDEYIKKQELKNVSLTETINNQKVTMDSIKVKLDSTILTPVS